ncbi:MAG: hypothetical protein BMS9Abin29_1303 [Gemmatimonadota bacterium]|nr:MAG: hypothetical protein BMS9Abin29_1303 [Gemmatimonadota bacterium]
MRHLVLLGIALSSLVVMPAAAVGQAGVEDAVRQSIIDSYAFGRDNLMDEAGGYSKAGSAEFWSSGGLLQWVPADTPPLSYESNSLTPKHIKVIPLADGVALVHMYVEGAYHATGQAPVPNYLTRGTLVVVLEEGEWVTRAAHWSPIRGGTGTNQTAID